MFTFIISLLLYLMYDFEIFVYFNYISLLRDFWNPEVLTYFTYNFVLSQMFYIQPWNNADVAFY